METEKTIHEDEGTPRELMKRGIWFNKDLEEGHTIERDDVILRRPFKGSINSINYPSVLGRKLNSTVKEGDSVRMEELE